MTGMVVCPHCKGAGEYTGKEAIDDNGKQIVCEVCKGEKQITKEHQLKHSRELDERMRAQMMQVQLSPKKSIRR